MLYVSSKYINNKSTNLLLFLIKKGIGTVGLIGMSSGSIKDNQITASGYWNNGDSGSPKHGRLGGTTGAGAWVAASKGFSHVFSNSFEYINLTSS